LIIDSGNIRVLFSGRPGFAGETRRAFRLYLCENREAFSFTIIAKDTASIPDARIWYFYAWNRERMIKYILKRQISWSIKMNIKDYTGANRDAWNEVVPLHQKNSKERLDAFFMKPGAVIQTDPDVLRVLGEIDVKGKDVIHLCCNNGIELMSLKNMGALRCVGVDISEAAVSEAETRANQCGIGCEFVCADVFDLIPKYEAQFDVVMLTAGCLGWMPDLDLFFGVCSNLLKPNGQILIHEIHPFSEMLVFDYSDVDDRTKIIEPYFRDEPIVENQGLDYIGKTSYEAKTTYWFVYAISHIINALYKNGIAVTEFTESERDISAGHAKIESLKAGIPLSMTMLGKKF
jgi:2-polyprenyl-3-methyl-5-hydroxy-6-metoxy-1,4-benzoquinol methylase